MGWKIVYFKLEWIPLVHHIVSIGQGFNWVNIFSIAIKDVIAQLQKIPPIKKPGFFYVCLFSRYHVFLFFIFIHEMALDQTNPPTPIYCAILSEENLRTHVYDICINFLSVVYLIIFKTNPTRISKQARDLESLMGD